MEILIGMIQTNGAVRRSATSVPTCLLPTEQTEPYYIYDPHVSTAHLELAAELTSLTECSRIPRRRLNLLDSSLLTWIS